MVIKNVVHVDDKDRVQGSGGIEEAFKKGYAVRIVRMFITSNSGKILIQKRSSKIKNSPLKWDQSAGGHVDDNETYLAAAKRELFEEMGINNVRLKKLCKYFTVDNYNDYVRKRHNVIFHGIYDGRVSIDNDEVCNYCWLTYDELDKWIAKTPQDFTKGFIEAYTNFKQHNFIIVSSASAWNPGG